jgi:hypothetical protein
MFCGATKKDVVSRGLDREPVAAVLGFWTF